MSQSVKDVPWLKRLFNSVMRNFNLTPGTPITLDARGWPTDAQPDPQVDPASLISADANNALAQGTDDALFALLVDSTDFEAAGAIDTAIAAEVTRADAAYEPAVTPAAHIDDPTGVTTDTDVEARAAIVSILNLLEAKGWMNPAA